jgi:hypothetical protein
MISPFQGLDFALPQLAGCYPALMMSPLWGFEKQKSTTLPFRADLREEQCF